MIMINNKTPEFIKSTRETFTARLAQANLASDIVNFVKKREFDDKLKKLNREITLNKTRHVLAENRLKKLPRFDSSLGMGIYGSVR